MEITAHTAIGKYWVTDIVEYLSCGVTIINCYDSFGNYKENLYVKTESLVITC